MSRGKNLKKNNVRTLTAQTFSKILYKTNFSRKKANQLLLGIDLLKAEIQRDLLAISVLKVEETYLAVLEKEDPEKIMKRKGKILFLHCLKSSCEEFLTQQYGYRVKIDLRVLKKSLYTKTLLMDIELLFQVPFYTLIDPKSPIFRLIYYPVYDFASESFIEALVSHLVLEISNCVVYFSILQFSSVSNELL